MLRPTIVAIVAIFCCAKYQVQAATCSEYNIGLNVNSQNTNIGDSAFTSSSQYTNGYRAARGRLNTIYEGSSDKKGGWMAAASDDDPWIEVDLQQDLELKGVITQGRQCGNNWVTSYEVQYKKSGGSTFYQVTDPNTDYPMIFSGNSDRNTQVTNNFPNTFTARYIRILPTEWYNDSMPSLRFELIGCLETQVN